MFWYDPFNTGVLVVNLSFFLFFLTTAWFGLMSLRESELRFLIDKNEVYNRKFPGPIHAIVPIT